MRTLKKGLGLGLCGLLICLLLTGVFRLPGEGKAVAAPSPSALLVMGFGPADSLRSGTIPDLQATVQLLWDYGFEVTILDAYNENGGISDSPHYRLHEHLASSRYNLLVYYGHGSNQQWSFSLPQDGNWARQPDTQQGADEARWFGDMRQHWQQEIQLASNAMVLLRHTCFSNGLEAADMQSGARVLSDAEIIQRINEYSYTFLNPSTGTRAYVASAGIGATPSYLEILFRNYNSPIADLSVPNYSASHTPGDGYAMLAGGHAYLAGMNYRKNRFSGGNNSAIWSQPAWAGDPALTMSSVCGGVPGDKNGDGDNSDLGEPAFPKDRRDIFSGESADYNFFPFLCVANPNAKGTWAEVIFYNEMGQYMTIYREVPADSRITIDFNANPNLRDKNLAVKVRSIDGTPLLAERPMYFRYHSALDGGSDAFGSREGQKSWYFAEGYTSASNPFMEYLCLGNFGTQTAKGTMTLMSASGEAKQIAIDIQAGSRKTLYLNSYIDGEVSAKIETDQPIVAERSMYFKYSSRSGSFIADGGHSQPGLNSLSNYWYFAEGHVSNSFDEWIALSNPGSDAANATLSYYTPLGLRATREVALPPHSRRTVLVNESFAREEDVSVGVTSDKAIAAERSMYFNYNGGYDDGHVSRGSISAALKWNFAEGSVFPGMNEYILVMNPGKNPATINATYLLGPGEGTHTATYQVGPGQRITVSVNQELAAQGHPAQVGLELASDQPVVAERAMYFNMGRASGGKEPIRGGHTALGVQDAAVEWYFAEAYTGN
ncbi:MAG: hypothetical protein A2W01_02915 [Candidatus Solincola sediminis]|uniref:Uncharacterized protein n=1 Tax=Candidatus Solincola sediminis TaxID=1797199 RepID=A0A1F2WM05_9ACTN|nr:MAG: hypothetical protein A2Y75_11700 [Candidatus Solincola sediminis]OFW58362.1 MAG: hypothetical protein A2W01_02915 [Candidatus Solincola sediminis]